MKMNKKGFTIVELVIVIAVIAILAGVLIPTFSGLVGKAQDSAVIQEARNKYTEYVGAHDYSDGTSPAQNIVIEVDDQYVIVKDAKLVDKVYDNKDVAKNDAKYTNGTAAAFLCEVCDDVTETPTDDKICDDCGKCITHVDVEVDDEGNTDNLCDICGECAKHDWLKTPVATGVCKVCYAECEHDWSEADGTCKTCEYACTESHTSGTCSTCGKVN